MSIRKRLWKKITFFTFLLFDMPRIPQNLRKHAIGMFNAGLTMNTVAMKYCMFYTLGNVFKQQGVRKIDHVVDVRASRRVAKTAILGTPTCAIASNCNSYCCQHPWYT